MLLLNIPFLCESMVWAYYARRCAGFFLGFSKKGKSLSMSAERR